MIFDTAPTWPTPTRDWLRVASKKRGPGRPRTITDMRAYKAQKAREYRAKKRGAK